MDLRAKGVESLTIHTTPMVPMGKCLSLKIGLAIRWTTTMAPGESGTSPSLKSLKSKAPQRRTHYFQPGRICGLWSYFSLPQCAQRSRQVLRQAGAKAGSVLNMAALPIPTSLVSLFEPFVSDAGRENNFVSKLNLLGHHLAAWFCTKRAR